MYSQGEGEAGGEQKWKTKNQQNKNSDIYLKVNK